MSRAEASETSSDPSESSPPEQLMVHESHEPADSDETEPRDAATDGGSDEVPPSIYDSVSRLDDDDVVLARAGVTGRDTRKHKQRATSDVRSLLSLGLALPLYGLVVGGAHAMPSDINRLLLERGWIPHVIMLLSCWCLSILLLKAVGLRAQRRSFEVELLPTSTPRISADNVTRVLDYIEGARLHNPALRGARSMLVERVVRLLEHFSARGDVGETATINGADADADAAAVASSFSLVKVLVWAIPILGFIGTVVGIGVAVGGFSQSIDGAEQLDTIKSSLGEVTSGLAVAFDTTLVALVASIFVMLPTSWVQKAEEQLINDIDDYCVTNILRRLVSIEEVKAAAAEDKPAEIDAAALHQLVVDAVAAPLGKLLAANTALMERMAEDHLALTQVSGSLSEQLSRFAAASSEIGPGVERAVTELGRATNLAATSTDAMTRTSDQLCRELGASRQLMQLLAAGMGQGSAPGQRTSNGSNGKSVSHASVDD